MAFNDAVYHGRTGYVYTGTIGSDNEIGYVQSWSFSETVEESDITSMGDTSRAYMTGLRDGTVTIDAVFDPGDTGQGALNTAAESSTQTGQTVIVTLYYEGTHASTHDHLTGSVVITSREITSSVDDVVRVKFTGRGSLTNTAGSA